MTIQTNDVSQKAGPDLTGQRGFSTRLVLELARRPGNLFVSPYGVWSMLAMLHPGARGETRELIERVLGINANTVSGGWLEEIRELTSEEPKPREFKTLELKGPPESYPESFFVKKKDFRLIVANAAWLQEEFSVEPRYVKEIQERFDARIEELDLVGKPVAACGVINDWADQSTRGRIPLVISPQEIDSLTRMILANATYFKDDWLLPFEAMDTRVEPFHRLEAPEIGVPMMHQTCRFGYFENRGLQAVRLLYSHSGLSMTVVLPGEIRRFEAGLTPQALNQLFDLRFRVELVDLALPRVRLGGAMELDPSLRKMELGVLFEESADFSGISHQPGVCVNRVKQTNFLQINERGTEAASVTLGLIDETAALGPRLKPREMIVDRPFWFFIRDKRSGLMLFAGRVEDPS